MKKKLYFAYGMNLNHAHMRGACPTAIPIGPRKIQGYRLVFRFYADIVAAAESCVWGGCWEIDESAEAQLDRIEGYPHLYKRLEVDGMMVYQMTNAQELEKPAPWYLEIIKEGLADFGYPPEETLRKNLGGGVDIK